MWVRRDPNTGQLWDERTDQEMTESLEQPETPEPERMKLRTLDISTVGVFRHGVAESVPFVWEPREVQIGVAGYGELVVHRVNRRPVADIKVGDYVTMQFVGGVTALTVRIAARALVDEQVALEFDWQKFRNQSGGSLLPDGIVFDRATYFSDVYRPIICDYCDKQAALIEIDGREVYCRGCATHFDEPREWVKPLTVANYRKAYPRDDR